MSEKCATCHQLLPDPDAMSPAALIAALVKYAEEDGESSWGEIGHSWASGDGMDLEMVPGLGLVKRVYDHGGEGQGDSRYVVLQVGSRYVRKDGYWVSHDGEYWDGEVYLVTPHERTIIVYEPTP